MDAITGSYISGLAAALSTQVMTAMGRRLRRTISGEDKENAFEHCLQAGIVAMLTLASDQPSENLDLLAEIFDRFFQDPDVAKELVGILSGKHPDIEELSFLFQESGYDENTLPGLKFKEGVEAFEAAFLAAGLQEPAMQGIIEAGNLMAQTRLQEKLLDQMTDLIRFLKDTEPETVGIKAGQIQAETVVNGTQMIYQISGQASSETGDDWEIFYLNRLIPRCEELDLAAIDKSSPSGSDCQEAIRVSDVFTSLYLVGMTRYPDQQIADIVLKRVTPEHAMKRDDKEKLVPIQAVEAAGDLDRLVILGQPGGGKSTLVNHITTQLAHMRRKKSMAGNTLPGWQEKKPPLPVRIILRHFAAWIPEKTPHSDEGLVWDYLDHQLHQMGCREFFPQLRQILDKEGGVVFFDGLDEVRQTDEDAKRSLIVKAISGFAASLDKCRIVVTCREYAYKEQDDWRLPESLFPVVELDRFGMDQIEMFAKTWYLVTGPPKGWDNDKCALEAKNLVDAVRSFEHLRELAQYPLLLTLMAQVHGRDGYLPKDRADLYHRAVDLLLAHWENRIVLDDSNGYGTKKNLVMSLGVRLDILRTALERMALAAHRRQEKEKDRGERGADILKEDLREELTREFKSLDKAEQVMVYIQHRAGLLQARDNRTYAFPHRTFQEFLAASCILKSSGFETTICNDIRRDQAWWREVFLLTAGLCRNIPSNICNLVNTLMPESPDENNLHPAKMNQAVLSAQALHETGFLKHVEAECGSEQGVFSVLHKRIRNWLLMGISASNRLAPKERAAAGKALAWIDDPRFREDAWYLPDDPMLGFVEISEGAFLMGSDPGKDKEADDTEPPPHSLELPGYYMARYPVTVAQFKAFVETTGYKPKDSDCLRGTSNHPVVYVTWYDAMAYCNWLTEKLREWENAPEPMVGLFRDKGWRIRLPSEAEWEKAARGTNGIIYPWGNELDKNRANYEDTGIGNISSVGCFPDGISPYGCLGMAGNVWEWTRSLWGKEFFKPDFKYKYDPKDGREDESAGGDVYRVLRGGAFGDGSWDLRCAARRRLDPDLWYVDISFRIVFAHDFQRFSGNGRRS